MKLNRLRRGISLLELMIALILTVTIAAAMTSILTSSINYIRTSNQKTEDHNKEVVAEARLTELLRNAYISPNATDTLSNFIATTTSGAGNADTLEFTTTGRPITAAALDTSDTKTFEERNHTFGPQGGITEAAISLTAVGSPPSNTPTGLYLRIQQPADGDFTQGGNEELLWEGITAITFEFWDGTDWATTWDTTTGPRRLPATVRLTLGTVDNATAYVITVPIIGSDVTSSNPVTIATS